MSTQSQTKTQNKTQIDKELVRKVVNVINEHGIKDERDEDLVFQLFEILFDKEVFFNEILCGFADEGIVVTVEKEKIKYVELARCVDGESTYEIILKVD